MTTKVKTRKKDKTPKLSAIHYNFIADILAECRSNPALLEFYDSDSQFWRKLDMHFAARLAITNPLFKIDKFIEACRPAPPEQPLPKIKRSYKKTFMRMKEEV